jgi:hypothetical protein
MRASVLPRSAPRPPAAPVSRTTLRSVDVEDDANDGASCSSSPPPPSVPPPLPARARVYGQTAPTPRVSHPEIADEVFAALRDLAFFETAVEAASFGLVTAMRALPSLAGLAMLRDTRRGGYVVVYARGPRSASVVRSRIAEDDPILGLSLARGGPTSVEYSTSQGIPERHALFGDPWSALIAPIQLGDQCIGALELVDPLDGRTLGESARHGLATIAHHLADFVRGLGPHISVANAFAPEQVGLEE